MQKGYSHDAFQTVLAESGKLDLGASLLGKALDGKLASGITMSGGSGAFPPTPGSTLDLADKGGKLVSGPLGVLGGGINTISGLYGLAGADNNYDAASSVLKIGSGGAGVVGGAAALGLVTGPVGWIALAGGGLMFVGGMAIDDAKNHYVPRLAPDLVDGSYGGQPFDPAYQR